MLVAIGDQIADRADLHVVLFGKLDQIRQAGHGAIGPHDLADHARGVQPGQPRNIDRRLGMARAHQNAACPCPQGKDMAGGGQRGHRVLFVDRGGHGQRPVSGRNAGADTFTRLNRDGERRFMTRGIVDRHHRQAKTIHPFGRHRQADQAAAMKGHEIDRLRGSEFGRDHQIALVFPVLVIDQNEHPPGPRLGDDVLGRGDGAAQVRFDRSGRAISCRVRHGPPLTSFAVQIARAAAIGQSRVLRGRRRQSHRHASRNCHIDRNWRQRAPEEPYRQLPHPHGRGGRPRPLSCKSRPR